MSGWAAICRGWALAMQGQGEAGLAQMHQGLAASWPRGRRWRGRSVSSCWPRRQGMLATSTEGLRLLAEALAAFEASGRGDMLAEAYRLQGNSCCAKPSQTRPRRKPASSRLWPLPAASRPNPGSCAPP